MHILYVNVTIDVAFKIRNCGAELT